jgi:diguanylate cyclase (GGDEF)-like protein
MEDFFHQARVLLTELVMKSDSRKWSVHHSDVQGLRVVLNLLVSNIYNREDALSNIIPQMKEMGIKSCGIYLYKNSMHHSITDSWQFPKTIIHSMGYGPENIWNGVMRPDLFSAQKILDRNFLPKDRRYTLVVAPHFYMDEQLGFIVSEIEMTDAYLFESLVVEISCALKLTYLMKSRQDIEERLRFALEELEEYNKRLSSISQTDELTGLLNRRGFMNQSRLSLSLVRKHKKNGVLFFADLDGLKKINDSYGHEEGDFALRTIAVILQKAFRETDIIARLGGDEFTVFTINTSVNMIQRFQTRIDSLLEQHNDFSGKPYRLSISIGAVPFSANGIENIESLLNQADILLYKQKTERKMQKQEEVKAK